MSYGTVKMCTVDQAFSGRVEACVVDEQLAKGETVGTANLSAMLWSVASANDVAAAYASALAANNPNPGGDESVITDGMILSSVQANWDQISVPSTP